MPHDLKFAEAGAIKSLHMWGVALASPACQESLESFQNNMRLAMGTVTSPGWSALVMAKWAEACSGAIMSQPSKDFGEKLKSGGLTLAEWNPYWRECNERMKSIIAESGVTIHRELEMATKQLEQIVKGFDGHAIHDMYEGLLKALCIQSWTALEVLFEDLHGKSFELHSSLFAQDVADAYTRRKMKTKGYKFGFRRREDFRYSYDVAFQTDPDIRSALHHQSIDALSAVRNLLVHKGGMVDEKFRTDELPNSWLDLFPSLAEGTVLKFDGTIVCKIIDASVSSGYALVRAVDHWLSARFPASLKP